MKDRMAHTMYATPRNVFLAPTHELVDRMTDCSPATKDDEMMP